MVLSNPDVKIVTIALEVKLIFSCQECSVYSVYFKTFFVD